jgi:hypothetical protein
MPGCRAERGALKRIVTNGVVAQMDRASDSESGGREFESRPDHQSMTPAELRTHGERLFGSRWQTKLARALPVTPRSVRHWLSGKHPIRPVIAARIRSLAAEANGRRA